MEATALVAIVFLNGQGKHPDWEDFVVSSCFCLSIQVLQFTKNIMLEMPSLMDSLSPKAKNRIALSVNILVLLVFMAWTWNLWMPFVFHVRVSLMTWNTQ